MHRGERIECFALTEPGAGSDARGIVTSAVRDGDDYVLNGIKQFISQADIADFIILFAVTGVDETPKGPRKRFTAFLVDKETPGVTVKPMPSICDARLQPQHDLSRGRPPVPASQILGEEGKGFDVANDWLYSGRVMLSAHCMGRAERVFDMAWSGRPRARRSARRSASSRAPGSSSPTWRWRCASPTSW